MMQEPMDIKSKILSTGIRVGTHVKTKFMAPFVTIATPDGMYQFDMDITLQRIDAAARFMNNVGPKNVLVCSGREFAYSPIEKFCEIVGSQMKLTRFMPGTLTNPALKYYIEPRLIMVSDPQVDEQAVIEATNAGIPVIGISNTDNITSNLDLIIPANNKGRRSLATIYWLLARRILIEQGNLTEDGQMQYEIDDFETKHLADD